MLVVLGSILFYLRLDLRYGTAMAVFFGGALFPASWLASQSTGLWLAGGLGLFAGPSAIAGEIRRQFEVKALGELGGLRESFYAVTVERRIRHPAVIAISEAARHRLFA